MFEPMPSGFPQPEPILADAIYTAEEVARLVFRQSRIWFYRHRQLLTRKESFPRPISKIGQPRWRGQDLLNWLVRDKTVHIATGTPGFENILRMRTAAMKRKRA